MLSLCELLIFGNSDEEKNSQLPIRSVGDEWSKHYLDTGKIRKKGHFLSAFAAATKLIQVLCIKL